MGVPVISLQLSWGLALGKSVEITYYVVLFLYLAIHLLFFFYFMQDFCATISFLFISIVDFICSNSSLHFSFTTTNFLWHLWWHNLDIWYSLYACILLWRLGYSFICFFLQYIYFSLKNIPFPYRYKKMYNVTPIKQYTSAKTLSKCATASAIRSL